MRKLILFIVALGLIIYAFKFANDAAHNDGIVGAIGAIITIIFFAGIIWSMRNEIM